MLTGKRILIGLCGGIAAYKVCELISALVKGGAEVRAVMTDSAQAFVTPLSLTTLCRHPVYTDETFWQSSHDRPLHIQLGEWADAIIIAPLTANTLAKLVYGLADNLLTNIVLASRCPILLAPAMNTDMWEQQPVQQNWQQIQTNPRFHWSEPHAGLLACDRIGMGRMTEPGMLLSHIQSILHTNGKRDLAGLNVLISAGGTREHIDPVRFIGNPATGKMGIALAEAALYRGAKVTLVHGPIEDLPLPKLKQVSVVSAEAMHRAILQYFPKADLTIMSAAVADVKPTHFAPEKLPKRELPSQLPLEPVPDILAELGRSKQIHQQLVGFAAQTGDIITPALEKLRQKKLDVIVANAVDQPKSGFGSDFNAAVLLDARGRQKDISLCSKLELAHHILDFVL